MKYINQVTLNTGHVKKTYPENIDKSIYFSLKRIFNDSLKPEGAELFDGYKLKVINAESLTIGTIFANDGAPVLTTLVSKNDDGAGWRLMHTTTNEMLATNPDTPAPLPYIVDRLEIGVMGHPDALKWTGDFSKCFGWIVLDPRKIR